MACQAKEGLGALCLVARNEDCSESLTFHSRLTSLDAIMKHCWRYDVQSMIKFYFLSSMYVT